MGVADIAKSLAAKIGLKEQGELVGLLHDLGKYSNEFQVYLKSAVGLINPGEDDFVDARGLKGKVDHSTAGALHAVEQFGAHGRILTYLIAGHHE